MKGPTVSIILPVYNCDKYIQEAIESILNQTYVDFELIIVNDGSTDQTSNIIKKFTNIDKRIIAINKHNTGLSDSLNTGLRIAQGKYIARIDADDLCLVGRLKLQVKFLDNHPEYIIVGSAVVYINENGKKLGYSHVYITDKSIKKSLPKINPLAHPSVMILKSALIQINGYEINVRQDFEDYYLWHRLKKMGKFYNIPEPLIKYRLLENSLSRGGTKEYFAAVNNISNRGNITKEEYNKIKLLKNQKITKKIKTSKFIKFKFIAFIASMVKTCLINSTSKFSCL
ncbi:MAG: glycosyltransferase family 2 protein [Bacteroidota bacterium]